MGNSWETPKHQRQGRTGPGPLAPKYASGKDRRKVRSGNASQVGKVARKSPCLMTLFMLPVIVPAVMIRRAFERTTLPRHPGV